MNRCCRSLQSRVTFLLPLLLTGLLLTGCDRGVDSADRETNAEQAPPVSTTPLRVVLAGPDSLATQLRASWAAVSEQPLELRLSSDDSLLAAVEEADVVIFPSQQMGNLQAAGALTALPDVALAKGALDRESVLAALRIDHMRWGSETYAVPLGAPLPAVWAGEQVELPEDAETRGLTWPAYAGLLAELPKGRAAEPLAEGWAAYALLSRAASQTAGAWLFDRQTLEPQITDPPYVRALEQLVRDAEQYPDALLTPGEIWQRLAAGELQLAIGWPMSLQSPAPELSARLAALRMLGYPSGAEVYLGSWQASLDAPVRVTLPSRSLVAALSSTCRQTTIARTLLNHLAESEPRGQLQDNADVIWPLRISAGSNDGLSVPLRSRYDALVRARLAGGQIRPSLRLPGAERYLAALDQEVRRAIGKEREAAEALREAAQQWEAITDAMGRRKQVRAWRQSQGMRAR